VGPNRNKCAEELSGQGDSEPVLPLRSTGRSRGSEADTEPKVLNLEQVASILQCSKSHVQNLVHGQVLGVPPLPHIPIGRRIMILRASLERWLEAVETHGDRTA
jgi:hypothetical protein